MNHCTPETGPVPLTEAGPADELEVSALVDQIEVLNASILRHDQVSAELFQAEGAAAERIAALPGAGPTLAPRLYVALARHAPNCASAEALQARRLHYGQTADEKLHPDIDRLPALGMPWPLLPEPA